MEKNSHYLADVSLKQTEGYLTVLNVAEVLKSLFSAYYKEFIFRAITEELLNGTEPENIVCFERSLIPDQFMSKEIVGRLEEIPINSDTAQFYYLLGYPHGLLPRREIEEIRQVYFMYDSLFPSSRRYNMDNGSLLRTAIDSLNNAGISDAVDVLIKEAIRVQKRGQDTKNIKQLSQRYEGWFDALGSMEEYNRDLAFGKIGKEELKDQKLYDRYYSPSIVSLANNHIPSIAIFNPEKRTMRFLGKELLGDMNSPYFFDLKHYSHNSPGLFDIIGEINDWLPVVSTLFQAGIYFYNKKKNSKLQDDFENIITFAEGISIEEKEALRQYCRKLNDEYLMKNRINKVTNEYLKIELKEAYEKGKKNYINRLKQFNIIINPDKKIKISMKKY